MRVSEKTIELNLCSQLNGVFGGRLIWFGLTQEQEAEAGFDACARTGSGMLILQFKASNLIVGGARRFLAGHDQMQALRDHVRADRRIYYALPTVGTTLDLTNNPNLLTQTWLIDVSTLPKTIPPATKKNGLPRKNGKHYIDMTPPIAVIHSEPFHAKLLQPTELEPFGSRKVPLPQSFNREEFRGLRRALRRHAIGGIVS